MSPPSSGRNNHPTTLHGVTS